MQELIKIKNLTRGYPNTLEKIFESFNFSVLQGDFCFIMGKSGIGKTTLLRFLIGQIQAPLGTLFYRGEDISLYTSDQIQQYRQKIGVVFQDYKLLDRKNVEYNIRYPLDIQGYDESQIQERLQEVLETTHLLHKKHANISELSGGEKQRVAIARAIIHHPSFLMADEATGNLDQTTSQGIMDTLLNIHAQGNTVICISHDASLQKYCKNKNPAIKVIQIQL